MIADLNQDKCLVTGGAGFIGAHLANELIKMGNEVVILDDLSGGFQENVHPDAKFVEGSITDHRFIQEIFAVHDFKYVYHLAAYAAEGLSHFIRRYNYTNNLIGSVNLINESVKNNIKCFIFTSSVAVYGKGQLPMQEDMVPLPEDPYGIAKFAVENDLKACRETFGLNYIIFRPHNVYGEYQNIGDRYRNVVGIFMSQLMQRIPLTVFGDGEQTRAFSYIGDVAPYIAKSVYVEEAWNEIFNVGADKSCTVNELAKIVMKVMGIECEIRYLAPRYEVIHAYPNHDRFRRVFNPEEETALEEGLQRMADWAKRVGSRKSGKFTDIEINEKLPPVWLEE